VPLLKPLPGVFGALPATAPQPLFEFLEGFALHLGFGTSPLVPAQQGFNAFLSCNAHPLNDARACPAHGQPDLLKGVLTAKPQAQGL